jgi:hypothetical protein
MSFDLDDLTKAKFKKSTEPDSVHENILTKYFGENFANETFSTPPPNTTPAPPAKVSIIQMALKVIKPAVIAIILSGAAVMFTNPKIISILAFTSKSTVNNVIYYGAIFLVFFIVIVITYNFT